MKIDVTPLMHELDDIAWLAIESAVCRPGAMPGDIGTAAATLNAAATFRRKCGAMCPEYEAIHAEYRVCLSLALMNIDCDDLEMVQAVADLIYPRAKQ